MPKFILLVIALLWTGIILYFCLVDSSNIPSVQIEDLDKVVHIFFHFVLTIVWFLFFKKEFQSDSSIVKSLILAFFFSFCIGIAVEFLQQLLTTTRHGDVLDVVANCVGAILGIVAILIANKLNLFERILKS